MAEERLSLYVKKLQQMTEDLQEKLQEQEKPEKLSGTDFEQKVYQSLREAGFDEKAISHSAQKFPDFILHDPDTGEKFGVEVKKTDSAKWEVIGGSIYESLKNDIDDTYILMAKLGGDRPEVRLRRYEECLADLKVTHSPRFYLNMELKEGEDYLTKNDAKDLLQLSGEELNRKIRKLLRTTKSTWWSGGETTAFSDLPKEEKGVYLNDGIALFPEVFAGDYRNFTPWLVYSCFVWCGNVRDIFSAGGNKYVEEAGIYVSAVMYRALQNGESIRRRIQEMTEEEMRFWKHPVQKNEERLTVWFGLVEENIRLSKDLIVNNEKLDIFRGQDKIKIGSEVKRIYMEQLKKTLKL